MAYLEWTTPGDTQIGISHLATEYALVPVSAKKAGVSYNPTSDVVTFAFMPTPTQVPQVSDWQTGAWDSVPSNVLYPYQAKCLVGPAGTITLALGMYIVYVKIVDSPEVPVLIAGQLQIT